MPADIEAVRAANDAFYAAFEARDRAAMASVWEQSDRVACTHPGAPTLFGSDAVARSWQLIFGGGAVPQFIITEERVEVDGDVAWVAAVENMIIGEASGAGSVVNWFARGEDGWLMVGHHGAPISRPPIV
jgi:ketosteroid isomerase-like protein